MNTTSKHINIKRACAGWGLHGAFPKRRSRMNVFPGGISENPVPQKISGYVNGNVLLVTG